MKGGRLKSRWLPLTAYAVPIRSCECEYKHKTYRDAAVDQCSDQ